jgi:hypothetical protein
MTGGARKRSTPHGSSRVPLLRLSFADARKVRRRELAIRFAFGAGISVVASVVAIVLGVRAGGLLLAFPAILPATLTLIEKKEGRGTALQDDIGAMLGSSSLALFGFLSWWLIPKIGPASALVAACAGWFASSLALYVVLRVSLGDRRS